MATTYSGRLVTPTNFAVPSVEDMAIQRGRTPRFHGATSSWWSVLHHVKLMYALARHQEYALYYDLSAYLLLHDGEETVTGDTMTTWKCREQRALEKALEERIYTAYVGRQPTPYEERVVKKLDRLCLATEMVTVGPPQVLEHSGLGQYPLPDYEELEVARRIMKEFSTPISSTYPTSPLCVWWKGELEKCIEKDTWRRHT